AFIYATKKMFMQPQRPTPEEREMQRRNTTRNFKQFVLYIMAIRIG
ncbi:18894_t:CDS:1, partial [Gigaspora margarita]